MKRAYHRTDTGTLRRLVKRAGDVVRWLGGCCCGPVGWIRATACLPETIPQYIVTRNFPAGNPQCFVGEGCAFVGGLTVAYGNRCYVIDENIDEVLPDECWAGSHSHPAIVYPDQPDGDVLAFFPCLNPNADCSDPTCRLPPPFGCCIESSASPACPPPNTHYCSGGKDVTFTWTGDYDFSSLSSGVEINGSHTTWSVSIRTRCVGQIPQITVVRSRTVVVSRQFGQAPVTTVYDPDTSVGVGLFQNPGDIPTRHPRISGAGFSTIYTSGCSGRTTTPTSEQVWQMQVGCRSGSGNSTSFSLPSQISRLNTVRSESWEWAVSIPCDRGSGLGDIPL